MQSRNARPWGAVVLAIVCAQAAADEASPVLLPAGTEVHLETAAPISTKRIKVHEEFALRTVGPVVVDGVEVVPAGTPALGQVIHVQKAGSFGKAAELILTVRRIDLAGQTVPMRKLEPLVGRDRSGVAAGIGMAPYVWPIAPFVRGGQIELPAGTQVVSFVAKDTALAPTAPASGSGETPPGTPSSEPQPESRSESPQEPLP
jgi:hypothetical protein